MKKLLRSIFCLLLICSLLPASALAEGSAEESPRLRQVMSDMGTLTGVNKTNYLLAQEPGGTLWGLYNTDGEMLMEYLYNSLAYVAYDCFRTSLYTAAPKEITLDYINSFALVNRSGLRLTDYAYGNFVVYNHYWASAWILEEATEEDYDYKYDKTHFYKIARCDVFYLGTLAVPGGDSKEPVLYFTSFTRDQFKSAQAHDRFLSIADREDKVTVYDSSLKPMKIEAAKVGTALFTVKNYAVWGPDGTMVMDGFTKVREANTTAGMLLIGSWVDYSGKTLSSVYNMAGEMLMEPTELTISSVNGDYAVVAEGDKKGLYSMKLGQQLLPCAYDNIITNGTGLDPYIAHGYACGERDGTRYFIDVATGQETLMYVYDKDLIKVAGGLIYYTDEKKVVNFTAADGSSFALPRNAKLATIRGDGYLIPYKLESHYRLDDWTGTNILNTYSNKISITDDNKIILNSNRHGYQLFELVSP